MILVRKWRKTITFNKFVEIKTTIFTILCTFTQFVVFILKILKMNFLRFIKLILKIRYRKFTLMLEISLPSKKKILSVMTVALSNESHSNITNNIRHNCSL